MVGEGKNAPDFRLPDSDGVTLKLSELKGQPVIVYFYPKDDTPGCTNEAKDFTRLMPKFEANNTAILGISPNSEASHLKFRDKHDLTVRLIADEEKIAANAYGVWVEKSMFGKKYMGVERATFLIGADGKVSKIWRKVKVKNHADDVLAAVEAL